MPTSRPTMEGTTARASLLGIPPKLRNEIYHCIASEPGKVTFHNKDMVPHALARVCRQTRPEFLPMFQAKTTMQVHTMKAFVYNFDFRGLEGQLARLYPHREPWLTHQPEESARIISIMIELLADDAEEVEQHQKYLGAWHAQLRKGWADFFRTQVRMRIYRAR